MRREEAPEVTYDLADPDDRESRDVLARYFAELDERFPAGFDPGDGGAGDDLTSLRAPAGAFVVLHHERDAIGCGGLQQLDRATAEIKRMWIDPRWRGLGLGSRLLSHLEELARELGYPRVVLDTNATLVEAVTMYERAGFVAIERYNDNPYAQRWYEKILA